MVEVLFDAGLFLAAHGLEDLLQDLGLVGTMLVYGLLVGQKVHFSNAQERALDVESSLAVRPD